MPLITRLKGAGVGKKWHIECKSFLKMSNIPAPRAAPIFNGSTLPNPVLALLFPYTPLLNPTSENKGEAGWCTTSNVGPKALMPSLSVVPFVDRPGKAPAPSKPNIIPACDTTPMV
jgi:hypothetical protein